MPHFALRPRGAGQAADLFAVPDPDNRRETTEERVKREIADQDRARTYKPERPAAGPEGEPAGGEPKDPDRDLVATIASDLAAEDADLQAELDALEAELEEGERDEEAPAARFPCTVDGCDFAGAASKAGLQAHVRAKHAEG